MLMRLNDARILCAAFVMSVLVMPTHADDNTTPSNSAVQARYVWAKNLMVHTAPDSKSPAVGRLPFGSLVILDETGANPVAYQDTVLKLVPETDLHMSAASIVLDGHWQHIRSEQITGWIFDGYLSRYPTPHANEKQDADRSDTELEFTEQIMGIKLKQAWKAEDSKKSPAYAAMRKHTKIAEKDISDEFIWKYVEFKNGSRYEEFVNRDPGALSGRFDYTDLPLTFNESVLWVHYFGRWDDIDLGTKQQNSYFGTVQAGRHFEIQMKDGMEFLTVDCKADTCDLLYGFQD